MTALNTIRLADYQPPAFTVKHHEIKFELQNHGEVVVSHVQKIVRSQPSHDESGWELPQDKHVALHAEHLAFDLIEINGKALDAAEYEYDGAQLLLKNVADCFSLHTVVRLKPDDNKELSGLYRSNGIYCTQCEAEGFRRITPTLDRPDVLATYRVRIEADQKTCPVLLSNGNPEGQGELPGGRHYAQWYDPHPKPSYLFALVAGNLAQVSRRITTPKGKKISLNLYTEPAFINQTAFAMQSLIDAIHWDEERFGLSYDLKQFNIVAISDFNMGAMENKSLNIFNTRFVLADTDTATDEDYHGIRAVIGHEYFHNWTGNRVTCRDWFQLSLKEGLTVFRDQEFSADLGERSLERIGDVIRLRAMQFPEDAGPMSHPVQPQEYAAIDNFYTATVYEKGAEIIRMYHTVLGEAAFQQGMKRYIERHDGQAVRIEDFAQAMSDGGEYDFTGQFFHWYTTRGTPKITFTSSWNQHERSFTVAAMQDIEAVTPPRPLVIPIRLALINRSGRLYRFADGNYEQTLLLEKNSATWTFERADADLIPVLMQNFSAPVYYQHRYDNDELAAIVAHAPDGFARFEAMQILYRRLFEQALKKPRELRENSAALYDIMQAVLAHDKRSEAEKALLLEIPALNTLLNTLPDPVNMSAAIAAHDRIVRILALKMRRNWMDWLETAPVAASPKYNVKDAGIRKLRGLAEKTLALFEDEPFRQQLLAEYQNADNMTTRMNALLALNCQHDAHRETALADFLERYRALPLVVDKWFAVQAKDESEGALARITALAEHAEFHPDNPNRFRALVSTLMQQNPTVFHAEDGSGYRFAAGQIRRVLLSNPQIAARMLNGYAIVSRMDDARKAIVRAELEALAAVENISVDVREVLERLQRGLQ